RALFARILRKVTKVKEAVILRAKHEEFYQSEILRTHFSHEHFGEMSTVLASSKKYKGKQARYAQDDGSGKVKAQTVITSPRHQSPVTVPVVPKAETISRTPGAGIENRERVARTRKGLEGNPNKAPPAEIIKTVIPAFNVLYEDSIPAEPLSDSSVFTAIPAVSSPLADNGEEAIIRKIVNEALRKALSLKRQKGIHPLIMGGILVGNVAKGVAEVLGIPTKVNQRGRHTKEFGRIEYMVLEAYCKSKELMLKDLKAKKTTTSLSVSEEKEKMRAESKDDAIPGEQPVKEIKEREETPYAVLSEILIHGELDAKVGKAIEKRAEDVVEKILSYINPGEDNRLRKWLTVEVKKTAKEFGLNRQEVSRIFYKKLEEEVEERQDFKEDGEPESVLVAFAVLEDLIPETKRFLEEFSKVIEDCLSPEGSDTISLPHKRASSPAENKKTEESSRSIFNSHSGSVKWASEAKPQKVNMSDSSPSSGMRPTVTVFAAASTALVAFNGAWVSVAILPVLIFAGLADARALFTRILRAVNRVREAQEIVKERLPIEEHVKINPAFPRAEETSRDCRLSVGSKEYIVRKREESKANLKRALPQDDVKETETKGASSPVEDPFVSDMRRLEISDSLNVIKELIGGEDDFSKRRPLAEDLAIRGGKRSLDKFIDILRRGSEADNVAKALQPFIIQALGIMGEDAQEAIVPLAEFYLNEETLPDIRDLIFNSLSKIGKVADKEIIQKVKSELLNLEVYPEGLSLNTTTTMKVRQMEILGALGEVNRITGFILKNAPELRFNVKKAGIHQLVRLRAFEHLRKLAESNRWVVGEEPADKALPLLVMDSKGPIEGKILVFPTEVLPMHHPVAEDPGAFYALLFPSRDWHFRKGKKVGSKIWPGSFAFAKFYLKDSKIIRYAHVCDLWKPLKSKLKKKFKQWPKTMIYAIEQIAARKGIAHVVLTHSKLHSDSWGELFPKSIAEGLYDKPAEDLGYKLVEVPEFTMEGQAIDRYYEKYLEIDEESASSPAQTPKTNGSILTRDLRLASYASRKNTSSPVENDSRLPVRNPYTGQNGGKGTMPRFARSRKVSKSDACGAGAVVAMTDMPRGYQHKILNAIIKYRHALSNLIQRRYVAFGSAAAKETAKDHIPAQFDINRNLFNPEQSGVFRADGEPSSSIRVSPITNINRLLLNPPWQVERVKKAVYRAAYGFGPPRNILSASTVSQNLQILTRSSQDQGSWQMAGVVYRKLSNAAALNASGSTEEIYPKSSSPVGPGRRASSLIKFSEYILKKYASLSDRHAVVAGKIMELLEMMDKKNDDLRGHSERVAVYALLIAREMGYGYDNLLRIYISALLHDIGKVDVPDEILNGVHSLDGQE
ncbi:MAG: HD domain-containing protein, partial [Candidatus Omnitrophica bacterium]|nr:HD domain-containing protein [Candidatus Omnitrophota bacterium]